MKTARMRKRVGTGVGGDGLNSFSLFVGPKDSDLLRMVNPKLDQVIDWGFFGVIAKPLFCVLNWTADHVRAQLRLGHCAGDASAINMVLFPLRISSMKSSQEDAGASAADQGDQRQVQRPADARSARRRSRTRK